MPVPEPTPAPLPPPSPIPTPQNRVLFGATYSNPTLPAVHNYQVQAVPVFGWGSTEANLDARIAEMRAAPYRVLTLCNGPQRFRKSPPGPFDGLGDRIEHDQHQAYADYCGNIIRRNNLPGQRRGVTHAQLWNEGKGYWGAGDVGNRWGYEESTDLQNRLYDAVKLADDGVLCLGPYVAFSKDLPGTGSDKAKFGSLNGPWGNCDQRDFDWLDYYLEHGKYDGVCVDGNLGCRPWHGPNGDQLYPPPGGAKAALQFFQVVAWYIRSKTDKPIWWSEIYPYGDNTSYWLEVADLLRNIPGEHVLMWWAESSYAPPPIV